MWGTWWEWDARLTSQLILLFLYLGYMALRSAHDDLQRADRSSAVLAIVGVVNVPIIHYSVYWWNSLHQGATVMKADRPSMPTEMLVPLLVMFLGFTLFQFYRLGLAAVPIRDRGLKRSLLMVKRRGQSLSVAAKALLEMIAENPPAHVLSTSSANATCWCPVPLIRSPHRSSILSRLPAVTNR